ncbi:glycosyltransferase family 2 protein [Patescibacteria group bacterium]|nr:glycosyltransferase family 2 protein [Patescibacteria group bacterium]
MTKNVSIIIPAYNEAESIESVVLNLQNELNKIDSQDYEIIIINDGSCDNTKTVLENIQSIEKIKIINHKYNKGYGGSLKTGIRNAKYDWILIIDADGTYPTNAINLLLTKVPEYDLVIGSREKKNKAIPWERKHAKMFLNKFASYLAGKKIPDLNSGLRIFKKEIILKYWELFPNKFSFTSTLTMVAMTHGYETKFIKIDYYKRQGKSTLKPSDFLSFIKLVIKLSLFFKPIKIFTPISLFLFLVAVILIAGYFIGFVPVILDTTIIILSATALQTFFFGLIAEIIIHNKQ